MGIRGEARTKRRVETLNLQCDTSSKRHVGSPRRHNLDSLSHDDRTRTSTTTFLIMPSIADHVDRLTGTLKSVKASASAITQHNHHGPFTRSVLNTPLGDLIRDIDPSELGLFTLVPPPRVSTQSGPPQEITRVDVVSATPLRKTQRRGVLAHPKEPDPEVFAEAALKYIDR